MRQSVTLTCNGDWQSTITPRTPLRKMMMKLQNTIKSLARAACILFLYNCGATAFLGSPLRSCRTNLLSMQLLRPSMHTRQQRRNTLTNNVSFRNHKLLLRTALDATESFDNNSRDAKAAPSPSVDKVALVLSDFHVITRVDAVDKIKHIELYLRRRNGGNILNCSHFFPSLLL